MNHLVQQTPRWSRFRTGLGGAAFQEPTPGAGQRPVGQGDHPGKAACGEDEESTGASGQIGKQNISKHPINSQHPISRLQLFFHMFFGPNPDPPGIFGVFFVWFGTVV